jgi:exopolyphosphatase/guanosine-5'-triphosphate,3'-diphosphate pyrophosphatase
MLNIYKYAAIDIGSNAIRLLISTITEAPQRPTTFKKTSLVRVPIRLGADVFVDGKIGQDKRSRLMKAMHAFNLLMECHDILDYRACATSAMRDADNGAEIVDNIKKETNIQVDIIDGSDEAAMIAATDLHELIQDNNTYLYVDVGGGSTELTVYYQGRTLASKSFNLGTVRLLNNLVSEDNWEEFRNWIDNRCSPFSKVYLIGSGGNINNIFKNSGNKEGKPLSYLYLCSYFQLLNSLPYEDRIAQLGLNQDRADVIVPATEIYLTAMKHANAETIYVPKIGLSDGIIKYLYNKNKKY